MTRTARLGFMLLVLLSAITGAAAADRWGIHFQVYGEPHEPDNPVYVNVLPLVYETQIANRATLKLGSVVGLRVADGVTLGNVGVSAGMPIFPFGARDGYFGFFAGPIITASYNFHTGETVVSTAADIGYSFPVGTPISMTLGGEIGVSTFFVDGTTVFRPHFGPAIYLYFGGGADSS